MQSDFSFLNKRLKVGTFHDKVIPVCHGCHCDERIDCFPHIDISHILTPGHSQLPPPGDEGGGQLVKVNYFPRERGPRSKNLDFLSWIWEKVVISDLKLPVI